RRTRMAAPVAATNETLTANAVWARKRTCRCRLRRVQASRKAQKQDAEARRDRASHCRHGLGSTPVELPHQADRPPSDWPKPKSPENSWSWESGYQVKPPSAPVKESPQAPETTIENPTPPSVGLKTT